MGSAYMSKLQCRLCGGALVMDETWDFAECEQCGMKYSKESMQKMLLDVQAADSKETRAEGYLFKAKSQMRVGDYSGAKNTCQKILDTIDPLSSDAWWGLMQCRFHYVDMLLSGELSANGITFLFDGKPAWDMSAFEDNLNNALIHAAPEQKTAYKKAYAEFMEKLPEKQRDSEANKGSKQLERESADLKQELDKLRLLHDEREYSLKDIKRKRKIRMLMLIPAVLGTLAVLYIAYRLLTSVRSLSGMLFEFIVALFIMVIFWMIFSFYKKSDLKKSKIGYLTQETTSLKNKIDDAESRLTSLQDRLNLMTETPQPGTKT